MQIDSFYAPQEILNRLHTLTEPSRSSFWLHFGMSLKEIDSRFDKYLFDGIVDSTTGEFQLSSSFKGRLRTIFRGVVRQSDGRSRMIVWLLPPAGHIASALILCSVIVYSAHRRGHGFEVHGSAPGLIIAFLLFLAVPTYIACTSFKSAIHKILTGVIPEPERVPWPELPDHFKNPPVRPDDEPDMIPTPDPTLVEHFESMSREILAHSATPAHVFRIDSNNENLTLSFPPRSADGFEVSAEVDNEGATVFAGGKEVFAYTIAEYSSETFDIVSDTYRLIRALLSPEIQLRVVSINGVLVKSQPETVDVKGKPHAFLAWKLKGKVARGIKSERILINRQMSRPT